MTDALCPRCGAKLPPGADTCPACSDKISLSPTSGTTDVDSVHPLIPPARVGPYKILERLGEGGMGVVYLAEQEQPFHRRVALKIIKVGMDTRDVIARFEAERQALALMDHPNIAHVYDAGATTEGRPFFVMEYVPGLPITSYCDKHRVPMWERLDLFVQVCGAIQHAHQKGVIHRDVKPSNLLVAIQDGKPLPKVIDFGVAKATNQRLTEKTVFTQRGVLLGTPAYMSPEQAEMGELTVDTTTDIYSLGVVLYELLISALPLEPELLRRAGYAEIQRVIREEEPLRPSARLSSQAGATTVALQRQMALPTLVRELKGDLDWITLKAMDKDRTRRYASASEFAADITRHLKTEPVMARPPSLLYRASKFVRKFRAALIAASLAVTVSTAVSTAVQTQSVVRATVQGTMQDAELLQNIVRHAVESAVARDRDRPWAAAVAADDGTRRTLEAALYARSVTAAAICDATGRVVAAADPTTTECPSGRPEYELASANVLTLLRGSIATDYVLSTPFDLPNRETASVRVTLNQMLIAQTVSAALRQAVVSLVTQIAAVALIVMAVSWLVFRTD